jgi:hypothetical protein
MSDSNKSGRLNHVEITIEGTEDLAIQPWLGPFPLERTPISGDGAKFSQENVDVLIVSEEDLTVRPWPRAQATPTRIELVPGPDELADSGPAHGVSQHPREPS